MPDKKKDVVKALKAALGDASELYLATDEDREGEAISWHVLEVLKPSVPVKRMVFHEITRAAIDEAIENPRELDMKLVEAQTGRRVLDRLFGYEMSLVTRRRAGGATLGRAGAERGCPPGRRARARPHGVPGRLVLGPRGRLPCQASADFPADARRRRRAPARHRPRLRPGDREPAELAAACASVASLLDEAGAAALAERLRDAAVPGRLGRDEVA